jgi:hypothetical protein
VNLISLRLPRAKAGPSLGSVIHAINTGVYEIDQVNVKLILLNLKENMVSAGFFALPELAFGFGS